MKTSDAMVLFIMLWVNWFMQFEIYLIGLKPCILCHSSKLIYCKVSFYPLCGTKPVICKLKTVAFLASHHCKVIIVIIHITMQDNYQDSKSEECKYSNPVIKTAQNRKPNMSGSNSSPNLSQTLPSPQTKVAKTSLLKSMEMICASANDLQACSLVQSFLGNIYRKTFVEGGKSRRKIWVYEISLKYIRYQVIVMLKKIL